MTDPIVKTVTVPVSPDQAFARFTQDLASWWPGANHSVSAGDGAEPEDIILEQREGGAVYEVCPDGRKEEWGQITSWTPPSGFSMTWHPGNPADRATQVSLSFEAVSEGTKVTLRHEGWQVLADMADEIRGHYASGWDHVFGVCYTGSFKDQGRPDGRP